MSFTFFFAADCQFWNSRDAATNRVQNNKHTIAEMKQLPGTPYSAEEPWTPVFYDALQAGTTAPDGSGEVQAPVGIIMAGDLTQPVPHTQLQGDWQDFKSLWADSSQWDAPLLVSYGNHDQEDGSGKETPGVQFVASRAGSYVLRQPGGKLALPTAADLINGHYSWDWGPLHFVNLNDHPGGTDPRTGLPLASPRAANARQSLLFLEQTLRRFGRKKNDPAGPGKPVVIIQHVGFDPFSVKWDNGAHLYWWTQAEQDAYLQLIEPYEVLCLLSGHRHQYYCTSNYTKADGSTADIPLNIVTDASFYCNGAQGFLVGEVGENQLTIRRRYTTDKDGSNWGWGRGEGPFSHDQAQQISFLPPVQSRPYTLLTGPLASCNVDYHLGVYALDSYGNVVQKRRRKKDGIEGGWAMIGNAPVPLTGSLAAACWVALRHAVYAAGTDGQVYRHMHIPDGWQGWASIGSPALGHSIKGVAAVRYVAGKHGVFAVCDNGSLYERACQNDNEWSKWANHGYGASLLAGPVAAVQWSAGHYGVYAIGRDNKVYERWRKPVGGWRGFSDIGRPEGNLPLLGIAALSWVVGRYAVFVVDAAGKLYQRSYKPTGWSGWKELPSASEALAEGVRLAGPITAIDRAGLKYELYAMATDGRLYCLKYENGWIGWSDIEGLEDPCDVESVVVGEE